MSSETLPVFGNPNSQLLPVGEHVGNYVIERLHAAGGNSTVYKVAHTTLKRAGALKVLHRDLLSHESLTRFRQEAESISRLQHPHIVEIYDIGGLKDGRPFILMEWLEGRQLSDELKARGTLTPSEVLSVLSEIGSALAVVHDAGFMHRDIKPSNVIALPDGQSFHVKLVDFGLVKALSPEAGATPLTQKGTILGTPEYMSPEQVIGGTIDARTDIYALGIMAFELLTGRVPFASPDLVETFEMHVSAPVPKVTDSAPVPAALDEVLKRALAKKAGDRYQSVAGLIEDFRRALSRTQAAATGSAGLGCYVEVRVEVDDDRGADEVLMQMDVALEQARLCCEALKLDLAFETTNAILGVVRRPTDEGTAAALLTRLVQTALGLELLAAARRDDGLRVQLKVVVHQGSLVSTGSGDQVHYTDGDVLRLSERAAQTMDSGVFVTSEALPVVQRAFRCEVAAAGSGLARVTLGPA